MGQCVRPPEAMNRSSLSQLLSVMGQCVRPPEDLPSHGSVSAPPNLGIHSCLSRSSSGRGQWLIPADGISSACQASSSSLPPERLLSVMGQLVRPPEDLPSDCCESYSSSWSCRRLLSVMGQLVRPPEDLSSDCCESYSSSWSRQRLLSVMGQFVWPSEASQSFAFVLSKADAGSRIQSTCNRKSLRPPEDLRPPVNPVSTHVPCTLVNGAAKTASAWRRH